MKDKGDYIGGIIDGEVRAEPVETGKVKSYVHGDFKGLYSGQNRTNWRYLKDKNTVLWNLEPDEHNIHLVNDFLAKRGIVSPKHKAMYKYRMEESLNFGDLNFKNSDDSKYDSIGMKAWWMEPNGTLHQVYTKDRKEGHWNWAKAYCEKHKIKASAPTLALLDRGWLRLTFNYYFDGILRFEHSKKVRVGEKTMSALKDLAIELDVSKLLDDDGDKEISLLEENINYHDISWNAWWMEPNGNLHEVHTKNNDINGHANWALDYWRKKEEDVKYPVGALLSRGWIRLTFNYFNDGILHFESIGNPNEKIMSEIKSLAIELQASKVINGRTNKEVSLLQEFMFDNLPDGKYFWMDSLGDFHQVGFQKHFNWAEDYLRKNNKHPNSSKEVYPAMYNLGFIRVMIISYFGEKGNLEKFLAYNYAKGFPPSDRKMRLLKDFAIENGCKSMRDDTAGTRNRWLNESIDNDVNFENWFNGSKVVDEQNKPLIVYHGSKFKFNSFSKDKIGTSSNTLVRGFFFTDSERLASKFGKNVMKAYLSLKNPMIIDAEGRNVRAVLGAYEEGVARDSGKDGFIVKNVLDAAGFVMSTSGFKSEQPSTLYIAFEPEQIKIINDLNEAPDMSLQGKTAMVGDKPLKGLSHIDVKGNIVILRNPEDSPFFAKGMTLVYFMDTEQAAAAMKKGEIPYLMVPRGTFFSGGNPITDVWKKKFQKPGTEHILGILEGNTMEDVIYVDMLTVRPGWHRNSIASKMMEALKHMFPKAKLQHSGATDKGGKFLKSYKKTHGIEENKTSLDQMVDDLIKESIDNFVNEWTPSLPDNIKYSGGVYGWWMDPNYEFHEVDVQRHKEWAIEYLKRNGLFETDFYDEVYKKMYDLGFVRTTKETNSRGTGLFYQYKKGTELSPHKLRALRDWGIEQHCKFIFDDNTAEETKLDENKSATTIITENDDDNPAQEYLAKEYKDWPPIEEYAKQIKNQLASEKRQESSPRSKSALYRSLIATGEDDVKQKRERYYKTMEEFNAAYKKNIKTPHYVIGGWGPELKDAFEKYYESYAWYLSQFPESDEKFGLNENMSYKELLNLTTPERKERAGDVRARSIPVSVENGEEQWRFRYKSSPTTSVTGKPFEGHITFLKESVKPTDNAMDLECKVDCSCPDYMYKFAYNNMKKGAGDIGKDSLNKCINRSPQPAYNIGEGLCKHLAALRGYLQTKISSTKKSNLFEAVDEVANQGPFNIECDD